MYASPVLPGSGRGSSAVANPDFLSAEGFLADVAAAVPCSTSGATSARSCSRFRPVPPEARLDPLAFADRLGRFLDALPRDVARSSVELRDRRLVTPAYVVGVEPDGRRARPQLLVGHAVARRAGGARGRAPVRPFMVVRLLLRPGTRYEARRDDFRPFNRIVDQDDRLRRDVTRLISDAAGRQQPVYVLVNNKAEGSAPLTIRALAEQLVAELDDARAC